MIEGPLKMMKNVSYFVLKALFVLKIFKFFSQYFCRVGETRNGLIGKIRLSSKFMTSQPDLQTIKVHILPSISQSKGNKTMKFGQLIEHSKRNTFLQKLYGK